MSLAILYSRAQAGIDAPLVTVEVHLANGLPGLSIVGLPELAVRESKDRVRGALTNSQFEFPTRRITINLAPADLPKEGGRFDLPIALGILAASGQIPLAALASHEFTGELALSGELRPVSGVLPAALAARTAGRTLIVPQQNAQEAALVSDLKSHAASHLLAVCRHLNGMEPLELLQKNNTQIHAEAQPDLADVKGQHQARRALEVAASGGHALLFIGPPGTGKSMLASRLPGILPPLTEEEGLESAAIASIAQQPFDPMRWRQRPFRAPHHTASAVALVGGGGRPRPGEISLAHNGVLFLDELPEFDRAVLEVLREPMESGSITISRAAQQAEFPARFQLVAAMNPCACGYLGDGTARCRCTAEQVARYRNRLSGPLLDRIDMHVEVPRQSVSMQAGTTLAAESSRSVAQRVARAIERQLERQGVRNHALEVRALERHTRLDGAEHQLLHQAIERLGLSMRAYHRILKLARTIADLEASARISTTHLSEAIGYRRLDRH
ncbi:MAG: YifB family Mg chelatase-like AAA ATPase [Candidatus Thiodiazotropha sp.]